MSQHEGVNHQAHMPAYQRHGGGAPPHPPHEQHGQYQPAAAHHLGAAIPSGPVYECDGIQFKMLDELVDVKVKRLRSEKIKPIEELTFDDIKAYNRNQLRAYCFVYGIKRKKKAEMEGNMARYAAMFHPNDPAFEITSFVPTDYVEGPIPRRRVPVTKEQKAQSAGKFAARFLPTQRARAPASMPQPAYSGVDPSNPSHSSGAYSSGAPPAHHLQPHHASQQQPNHQPPHQQQPPHHQPHHQQQPHHQHHQQHQHQQQHYRGGQSTAQQQQPHPNNYNLSSYHMVAHNLPLEMGEE